MEEGFNMNVDYLLKISNLVNAYIIAVFEDDFYGMYKALNLLEISASPKIDNDKIEKQLEWLDRNIDSWCVKDDMGNVIKVHDDNRRKLLKGFNETYRLLLIKLEEKGILTKKTLSASKVMGDFSET